MNILFTTYQGGIAGSSYSIFDLACGLQSKGHSVHFAGRADMPLYRMLVNEGIQCHPVRFSSYLDLGSALKLKRIISQFSIEVVNPQAGVDRTVMIWCKLFFGAKAKLVFTRRQLPIDEPWLKRKFHLSAANSIICTSEASKKAFRAKGYPESRIHVIQNGIVTSGIKSEIDFDFMRRFRDTYRIKNTVVGCVSRKKRQDILIQAIPLLPVDWKFLFVGISERDLAVPTEYTDRVIFVDRVPREEAHRYYQVMDAHALLSDAEGFGMTPLEAMRAGVPNVASGVGGVQNVINHLENGLLIENTPESLASALLRITKERDFRDKLVENGKRTVCDIYPISNTIDGYETHFLSLIHRS